MDENILKVLVESEREAAGLMLGARDILAKTKTDHRNVVTKYDKNVQSLLTERIKFSFPEAEFFCEESDERSSPGKGLVFIIDPIDGTMNFVRGFNHSCISAACCVDGELRAAAVYNPYTDEQFTAVKGSGAWLNGERLHVYDGPLSESIVCCGTAPYEPELTEKSFAMMEKAFRLSLDIRRQGSAELDLCSAAAGRAGVYFELSVSLWDYAAGMLIVNEAGGICRDIEGRPLPFDGRKTSILAGGPKAVQDFLDKM